MKKQDDDEVLDWDFYLKNPPLRPSHFFDIEFTKRRDMIAKEICASVIYCSQGIVVKITSVNEIAFVLGQVTSADLSEAMKLICNVIPHVIDLDADLAKAIDNGWRTRPTALDYIKVKAFIKKFPETAQTLGYLINW